MIYKCSVCRKVFKGGQTEKEALDELRNNFGEIPLDECNIVCDGYYKEIRKEFHG